MKYLVMMTARDPFYTMPGSVIRQIITSSKDKYKQQMEQGKLELKYSTFEGKSTVLIYECESHEELQRCIDNIPASGMFETKVYPLIDYDETMNSALENMEIADDMQPGGTVK